MTTGKIRIFAFAALLLSVAIIFIAAFSPTVSENTAQASGSIEEPQYDEVFTLKSFGDKIGIFIGDESTPSRIISVDPKSLPLEAQLLLDRGITVNGHEELLLLIEDYTG